MDGKRHYGMVLAVMGGLFLAGQSLAHHSFAAAYDMDKPITRKGTITQVQWINPHSQVQFDVKDASGKVVNWNAEVGTPNALIRAGITKASFKTGTEIVVTGFPARDGSNRMSGRTITTPDGKPLFQGPADR